MSKINGKLIEFNMDYDRGLRTQRIIMTGDYQEYRHLFEDYKEFDVELDIGEIHVKGTGSAESMRVEGDITTINIVSRNLKLTTRYI
jgi:hypothetical protein